MAQPPPVRRRLVGSLLRQYREAHGFKLEDVARILECDRSKISRIETGERGVRGKELRELLTEYGVDSGTQDTLVAIVRPRRSGGWWEDFDKILPGQYLDFIVAEGLATQVMVYAPLHVPEPLATGAYVRALALGDPAIPDGQHEWRVGAAIARQKLLSERRPDLQVILGEAALRQQIGSLRDMREQFIRLHTLASEPGQNIRILPFRAGAHAAGDSGGFSVLHFDQTPELGLVHISGASGGICLDDADSTTAYGKVFSHLHRHTLTREQTIARFHELARAPR
jgi:transcriptional regulator with XRE-family HTH domain